MNAYTLGFMKVASAAGLYPTKQASAAGTAGKVVDDLFDASSIQKDVADRVGGGIKNWWGDMRNVGKNWNKYKEFEGMEIPGATPLRRGRNGDGYESVYMYGNPEEIAASKSGFRNAVVDDLEAQHRLARGATGIAGAGTVGLGAVGATAYGMGDADTTGNKMRQAANKNLGTDFKTQSRFSNAFGG